MDYLVHGLAVGLGRFGARPEWVRFKHVPGEGGGGQLAQILGRYVPRQNQKVDPLSGQNFSL